MFQFGSGNAWINPIGGNLAANPTPTRALTLQDLSLDISQELVEQRGQFKFPDDIAPGDMKIAGKLSIGRYDIDLFNQIMFGDTRAVNAKITTTQTAPIPTTPFTITVTNSATFGTDLGVQYAGTPPAGNQIKLYRVTGTPATGQYAVSAGVYTFAAADTGLSVIISYQYLPASAPAAFTTQVNNQLMGYGPTCEIYYQLPYNLNAAGLASIIHLTTVRFSKLNMPIKRKGYLNVELDYQAYPNLAGLAIEFTNSGVA